MNLERGLFDHMVLQRDKGNASAADFSGTCIGSGVVTARVVIAGKPVRGFNGVKVGKATDGRFTGLLKGIPTGGPYAVELQVRGPDEKVSDRVVVKDVLVGDVWILAGQSNMQGCGLLEHAEKSTPMVRAFYMNDMWGVAKDSVHNMCDTVDQVHIDLCGGVRPGPNNTTGTGPGVSFGREMHRLTKIPQGLLACAHGGTTMAQWDPAKKDQGSKSLYGAMLRRVAKNGGHVSGVVWYQGESETSSEQTVENYTRNMQELVGAMRADLGNRTLPIAVVQLSRFICTADSKMWNNIQEQQRLLPKAIKYCVTVPAIDLTLDDNIHVSGQGQVKLGKRLGNAMFALLHPGKGQSLPIEIKRITPRRDPQNHQCTIEVEFANVAGKLHSDQTRPTGFELLSDRNEPSVYDIQLSGNKAILRTCLSTADAATRKLWYGQGMNPVCNIQDEAGRSLPVFGPIPVGKPRALSQFARVFEISAFQPSAGKLDSLPYPTDSAALAFSRRAFTDQAPFICVRPQIMERGTEDLVLYFRHRFKCDQPMKLGALIGYDGPLKAWLDGTQVFHDPNGTNPAIVDHANAQVHVGPGEHELLLAMATNHGKAWGIVLRYERTDVTAEQIKQGNAAYGLPELLE